MLEGRRSTSACWRREDLACVRLFHQLGGFVFVRRFGVACGRVFQHHLEREMNVNVCSETVSRAALFCCVAFFSRVPRTRRCLSSHEIAPSHLPACWCALLPFFRADRDSAPDRGHLLQQPQALRRQLQAVPGPQVQGAGLLLFRLHSVMCRVSFATALGSKQPALQTMAWSGHNKSRLQG